MKCLYISVEENKEKLREEKIGNGMRNGEGMEV